MQQNGRTERLTRQGVRDINGPNLDGQQVNGKRPTCPHYLAPDLVSVERRREPRELDGVIKNVNVYYCANCGALRFVGDD